MLGIIFWIVLLSVAVCSGIKLSNQTGYFKKSAENDLKEGKNITGTYTDAKGKRRSLITNKPVNIVRNNRGERVVYGSKGEYLGNLTKQQNNKREREQIKERINKAKAENPNVRYVMAGVQANDNAKAKGVTGNVYVDVNNWQKKYVKRYFNYPVSELGNKNLVNEYFGALNTYSKHYSFHRRNGFYQGKLWYKDTESGMQKTKEVLRAEFTYWMDVESGKLIELTDECDFALQKLNNYNECVEEAERFKQYFNTCQLIDGFIKMNHSRVLFETQNEEERKFYCSAKDFEAY